MTNPRALAARAEACETVQDRTRVLFQLLESILELPYCGQLSTMDGIGSYQLINTLSAVISDTEGEIISPGCEFVAFRLLFFLSQSPKMGRLFTTCLFSTQPHPLAALIGRLGDKSEKNGEACAALLRVLCATSPSVRHASCLTPATEAWVALLKNPASPAVMYHALLALEAVASPIQAGVEAPPPAYGTLLGRLRPYINVYAARLIGPDEWGRAMAARRYFIMDAGGRTIALMRRLILQAQAVQR